MRLIKETTDFKLDRDSVVTLGKFDGVHKGHRKLIGEVGRLAKEKRLCPVLFTFDVPPAAKLTGVFPKVILTNEEKRLVVGSLGMDVMIECPFLPEIMNMEPEIFAGKVLAGQMRAKHVVVGSDFAFGANRTGTPKLLEEMGARFGFMTTVLEKVCIEGLSVSSTLIRERIEEGRMEEAATLLAHPYFLTGEIVHGRQLGRRLGVPTINQIPPAEKLLPKRGVYASVTTLDGRRITGMTNIGMKPTVMGNFEGAETYLFDFHENAYGAQAKVELMHFLRPEQKFPSLEALKAQLQKDEEHSRAYFTDHPL